MLNIKRCCGCEACKNKCPKNAITMSEDSCGFLYPEIDNLKCINCKLCESVCPQNTVSNNTSNPTFIMASSKDKDILKNSSSGGVFYQLAKYILLQNGYVFGAYQDENFKVYHNYIDNINDINKLQLSKYIQSDIGNSYIDAKSFLDNNKKVLFVGTPCQCAGLKSFLGKEYDNLYCIDLLCHGVPSYKELKCYLSENYKDIESIKYRYEDVQKTDLIIKRNDMWEADKEGTFFKGFLRNIILRDSCYNCQYSKLPRYGDITIGDAWNKNKVKLNFSSNKISIISINSTKGNELFNFIKDTLDYQVINDKAGINYNMFTSGASINDFSKKKKFVESWKHLSITDSINSI